MLKIFLLLFACYILGSVPIGLIIGKITRGIDIRNFGSGNIGASNVLRTLGIGWGIIVFVLDTLKGFIPVYACQELELSPWLIVIGGMLCICGHNCSVFLRFKGGKGVSSSLGMIIGLNPVIAAIAFALWCLIVLITRYISVASVIAALSVPIQMILWKSMDVPFAYKVIGVIAALAIVVKHKSNFKRLLDGTESKIGQKVKVEEESDQND